METIAILNPKAMPHIERRANFNAIIINSLIIVAGIYFAFFVKVDTPTSNLNIARLFISWSLLIAGSIGLITRSTHWVYTPSGKVIRKSSTTVYANDFDNLRTTAKRFGGMTLNITGPTALEVDYIYTTDRTFAAYQISQPGMLADTMLTDVVFLEGDYAKKFIRTVKRLGV